MFAIWLNLCPQTPRLLFLAMVSYLLKIVWIRRWITNVHIILLTLAAVTGSPMHCQCSSYQLPVRRGDHHIVERSRAITQSKNQNDLPTGRYHWRAVAPAPWQSVCIASCPSSLDNICSGGLTRVPARQTTNLAISREAERDKGNTAPHLHRPVPPCPTPLPRSHAGSVESRVMAMAGRSHYDHITI